ncbi:hypothetical protein Ciccas_008364 [Cichlidogyrus casuarinus]|uniref:RUN domain-containing protein n=1 Tax=Cichlidogyrus casuarinus TaxID=1844966 RepID=A0ABD2Q0B0_9PLAT
MESNPFRSDADLEASLPRDVPIERWQPLGANSSPDTKNSNDSLQKNEFKLIAYEKLSAENERLNSSLLFLSTHFAQVQFRLDQIVNADAEDKDNLLVSLKEFASQSLPDVRLLQEFNESKTTHLSVDEEQKLINQLRSQLHDLEFFALENGKTKALPTKEQLKRHQFVIQKLKDKLDLPLSDIDASQLSECELTEAVESAVNQVLNPIKTNEKLVQQLKTQIHDLERFIDFLHGKGANIASLNEALRQFRAENPDSSSEVDDEDHVWSKKFFTDARCQSQTLKGNRGFGNTTRDFKSQNTRETTVNIMKRALAVLQLFALSQMSKDSSARFQRQMEAMSTPYPYSKSTISRNSAEVERMKQQHWGDARARLELAIQAVLDKAEMFNRRSDSRPQSCSTPIAKRLPPVQEDSLNGTFLTCETQSPTTNRDQEEVFDDAQVVSVLFPLCSMNDILEIDRARLMLEEASRELLHVVRRVLCPALKDLIEHGLLSRRDLVGSTSLSSGRGSFASQKSSKLKEKSHRKARVYSSASMRRQRVQEFAADDDDDVAPAMGEEESIFVDEDSEEDSDEEYDGHRPVHAWTLFMHFYQMKDGEAFNATPARKLSQSFNLEIVSGKSITNKQRLLSALGTVIQIHEEFKRSEDSQFKSFITLALNERKLVSWLKLVLRNRMVVDTFYEPWSYTASTGFEDTLDSLQRLQEVKFDLPYDVNVRHLRDIRDAF